MLTVERGRVRTKPQISPSLKTWLSRNALASFGGDLSAGEAVKMYSRESICGFITCARGSRRWGGDDKYEGREGEPGGSWGGGYLSGAEGLGGWTYSKCNSVGAKAFVFISQHGLGKDSVMPAPVTTGILLMTPSIPQKCHWMSAAVGNWKTAEPRRCLRLKPWFQVNSYTEMSWKCCRAAFLNCWVATHKSVAEMLFLGCSFRTGFMILRK